MKKKGVFDKDKLVFQQIPPKVHLEIWIRCSDLPGHPKKPVVFIFNVAWGNEYLQDMLAVLKKNNVKATFFLEGNWTKKNPDLAKMIKGAGMK